MLLVRDLDFLRLIAAFEAHLRFRPERRRFLRVVRGIGRVDLLLRRRLDFGENRFDTLLRVGTPVLLSRELLRRLRGFPETLGAQVGAGALEGRELIRGTQRVEPREDTRE